MLHFSLTPFPELSTQRLLLRQLDMRDENTVFTLRSDEKVNAFLGRQRAVTIDDARKFITKITDAISRNESAFWAICLKNDHNMIGSICLWNISHDKEQAEIGYELLPSYQGKGFMQEAFEAVLRFGFRSMKAKRIEAWTTSQNLSSIRVLERNHFQRDERQEQALNKSEEPDTFIFFLHNTET
jgi:ribosomal-protein-alanine N-acetyltransferase